MNKRPAGFFHPLFCSSLSIAAVTILLTSFIVGPKESKNPTKLFVSFAIITTVCLGAGGTEPVLMMDAIPFAQLDVHQLF